MPTSPLWRKFFVLADVAGNARRAAQGKALAVLSPICREAVQRIDALFDIERVSTTAFTAFGVENLKELLTDLKPERPPA